MSHALLKFRCACGADRACRVPKSNLIKGATLCTDCGQNCGNTVVIVIKSVDEVTGIVDFDFKSLPHVRCDY